jgi:hypothetical protein
MIYFIKGDMRRKGETLNAEVSFGIKVEAPNRMDARSTTREHFRKNGNEYVRIHSVEESDGIPALRYKLGIVDDPITGGE